jgi:hypothetical protein
MRAAVFPCGLSTQGARATEGRQLQPPTPLNPRMARPLTSRRPRRGCRAGRHRKSLRSDRPAVKGAAFSMYLAVGHPVGPAGAPTSGRGTRTAAGTPTPTNGCSRGRRGRSRTGEARRVHGPRLRARWGTLTRSPSCRSRRRDAVTSLFNAREPQRACPGPALAA